MPEYMVDEDLVALVWELAEPKPFENLTFNVALRRVLARANLKDGSTVPSPVKLVKKATSPSASEYLARVPELQQKVKPPVNWSQLCVAVGVDPKGDSARRKMRLYVAQYKPQWPPVPKVTDSSDT